MLLSLEDCAMKKTMQFISFIKTVTASLSGYRYTYHKVKVVRDHVEYRAYTTQAKSAFHVVDWLAQK